MHNKENYPTMCRLSYSRNKIIDGHYNTVEYVHIFP